MKTILAIITALAITSGAAFAGCGKKVTSAGKLAKFDKDKKVLTMDPPYAGQGKVKALVLTPKTVITGKDGKPAKIKDLVGKEGLVVISEHGKIDSIAFKKAEEKDGDKKGEKKDS